MTWSITPGLAPRLAMNNMKHDPATLIKTLVAKNRGSCKKFCTQEKNMHHNLACLKEYFGSQKLACQFLEELVKTKTYDLAIMPILSKLRSHLRRHGDTQLNMFKYENDDLTLRLTKNIAKEHRMQDKFVIDSQAQMTPTARVAVISEASDELESHKTFFNNFKKREICPACGRHHGNFPYRCERRGEKFLPDWMNKCIRQHNL